MQSILGMQDNDIEKQVHKLYNDQTDIWMFANSDTKKMMTLVRSPNGK